VTREQRLRAAIETTLGRTQTAAGSDDEQVMFEALGEFLTWVCALDDSFAKNPNRNGYMSRRDADSEGRYLLGLRYARNRVIHGHAVLDVAQSAVQPNPVVMRGGADAHRVSRIITPPTRVVWTFKPTLLPLPRPEPKLEAEYAAYVGGQDVTTVIRGAVNWLDRTLSTP
jgi:hypothetical protein